MLKGSRGSLHNKLGQQLGSHALDAPATACGLVGSAITLPCSCLGLVQRDTGAGGRAWHLSPAIPKAGRLLSEGCGGSRALSEPSEASTVCCDGEGGTSLSRAVRRIWCSEHRICQLVRGV